MRSRTTVNNAHDTLNVNALATNPLTTSNNLPNTSSSSTLISTNSTTPTVVSSTSIPSSSSSPYYRSSIIGTGNNIVSTNTADETILPVYNESNHKDVPYSASVPSSSSSSIIMTFTRILSTYVMEPILLLLRYGLLYLCVPIINRVPCLQSYTINVMNNEYRNQRIRKRYISFGILSLFIFLWGYKLYQFLFPSVSYITDSTIYQQYLQQSIYTEEKCTTLGYTTSYFGKVHSPTGIRNEASQVSLADALVSSISRYTSSSSISNPRTTPTTKHIVLTESNIGFAPITENWLRQWHHILYGSPYDDTKNSNNDNTQLFIVGLDTIEFQRIQQSIITSIGTDSSSSTPSSSSSSFISTWMDPDTSFASDAQGFFSSGYLAIVFHKWKLLGEALNTLITKNTVEGILLMDVDALPFRNPLKYIETLPYCDAYFATETAPDKLFSSADVWYPEPSNGMNDKDENLNYDNVKLTGMNYINTGFMYLRTTPGARKFVNAVVDKLSTIDPSKKHSLFDSDQAVANHILETFRRTALKNNEPVVTVPDIFRQPGRPSCARYGKDFTFGILNPYLFQNGKHAWENGGLIRTIHETPFMRHYNYLGFSPDSKVAAMKTDGIWLLTKDEEEKLTCQSVVLR